MKKEDILYYRKLKYETRLWCISQQVSILAPAESFLAVTEEHTHVGTLYYGYMCGNYSFYINEQLYCYTGDNSFENDVKYTKEMVDDIRRHVPCLMFEIK